MEKSTIKNIRLNTIEKLTRYLTEELPRLSRETAFDGPKVFSRSQQLLERLGNPQNFNKSVHVAGTSGKGTVCYMIDAILRAHNKRTALLVSPHVYDMRERAQINHQYTPERLFIEAANEVLREVHKMASEENAPSYYETMAAIAFTISTKRRVNYMIVEAGVGGRYDTSNTMKTDQKYCVITQIGLDHTHILGTTYEQIAHEKGAILYPGAQATILSQKKSVNQVFENIAATLSASISWVEPQGKYEFDDLLIALNATREIAGRDGWLFDEEAARNAVKRLYIPGRFEKRTLQDRLVILDGAHNPQKLAALADRLNRESNSPATILFSMNLRGDIRSSLTALKPVCDELVICEFFYDQPRIRKRSAKASDVATIAHELGFEKVTVEPSPQNAMRYALNAERPIVVCGSFYLLGVIDKMF